MTQRGHGPTEQREWGEPIWVLVSSPRLHGSSGFYWHLESYSGPDPTRAEAVEAVSLAEAEAALSRVEGERDELAAHLERVRERVWPYRSENEYDPGSTPGPPPDRYFEGVGDLADAVLSLLPDPKGER